MKRSEMKRGTSELKRSGPLTTKKPMARGESQLARAAKPMRARSKKSTPVRRSAKMESCTINLPGVCNGNASTVVWCHENSYAAGKGMGLKAKDEHGAYGCCACHAVYDGQASRPAWLTKEQVDTYFDSGKKKSRDILEGKGLISKPLPLECNDGSR